jgi:hypothetical protein
LSVETGHIAPAVARIECAGTIHSVIWRDGALETPDHADPDAERALAALGGEPCRCVELLDAWAASSSDPRALVLGPRGPEVHIPDPDNANTGQSTARFRRPLTGTSVGGRGLTVAMQGGGGTQVRPEPPEDPLREVLELGGAISHRLVLTVAAALTERTQEPELRPLLEAALYGRVLTALSRWLGEMPALELTMIEADASPALSRDGEALVARLPFRWLVDVWAAGLETVAGQFALSAAWDPVGGWELLLSDQRLQVNTCTLSPR